MNSSLVIAVTEICVCLGIILLCTVVAVLYGIAHDQVTARICVEYFTIGHPPVFRTESPTLLGLGWGIIAAWWVGFILGIPLAIAARLGNRPKISPRQLVSTVAMLAVIMALCATTAGIVGHALARNGSVGLHGTLGDRVPSDRHVAFLTAGFAHSTSYLIGFLGGIIVIVRTWWRRRMLSAQISQ